MRFRFRALQYTRIFIQELKGLRTLGRSRIIERNQEPRPFLVEKYIERWHTRKINSHHFPHPKNTKRSVHSPARIEVVLIDREGVHVQQSRKEVLEGPIAIRPEAGNRSRPHPDKIVQPVVDDHTIEELSIKGSGSV